MKRVSFAIGTLLLMSPVAAQEILLDSYVGVGTRSMGMGGAVLGLSDDAAGLYHNPAGLARIRRSELRASFIHSNVENNTQFFGSSSRDVISSTRLGGLTGAYRFPVYRGSFVMAAGYARTGALDGGIRISGYDAEVQFEKEGLSRDRGYVGSFSMGGAIDLAPGLSFGIARFLWTGKNRFDQQLTLTDTRDAHADTIQLFERLSSEDDFESSGIRAGLLYAHPSGARVGVSARSPVRVKVSSALEDEFVDESASGGVDSYPTEQFSDAYELTVPWEFGLGFAWTRSGLTLAGDVVYSDFRHAEYGQKPRNVTANVDDFATQYRARPRIHVGVEYRARNVPIRVRTGYFSNPLNYIGGDGLPDVEVFDSRRGLTFGVGGDIENALSVDAALVLNQYRQQEGRREDDVQTVRLFVSFSYQGSR